MCRRLFISSASRRLTVAGGGMATQGASRAGGRESNPAAESLKRRALGAIHPLSHAQKPHE